MFFTEILPIILLVLIVIFDAAKDVIKSRYDGSFFDKNPKIFPKKWWDSRLSWKNKWQLDENGNIKLDEDGERIPKKLFGIIDFPDAFTNGWHLIKFFLWTALLLAISINLPLFAWYINFVILSAIYLLVWWLSYNVWFLGGKK